MDAPLRLISAASLLELTMVIEARLGEAGAAELDLWLHKAGVEITPVDVEQAYVARRAWRKFGKERHPAGLNHGDCFSYARAATRGEPLLFPGEDFFPHGHRSGLTSRTAPSPINFPVGKVFYKTTT